MTTMEMCKIAHRYFKRSLNMS